MAVGYILDEEPSKETKKRWEKEIELDARWDYDKRKREEEEDYEESDYEW